MALSPGIGLGPYEILTPLGVGGMGEVYRARDTRLDRTVAIKVLPAHLSENPRLRQRFEREARALASLAYSAQMRREASSEKTESCNFPETKCSSEWHILERVYRAVWIMSTFPLCLV